MKFDSLYNKVFLTEQNDEISLPDDVDIDADGEITDTSTEIAEPENFETEPAPVNTPAGDAGSLNNYIGKLEEVIASLNGVESDSLQKLVNDLDRPGSLYTGIANDTSPEIIKLAEQTASLVEILKGYIINSAKRQRDLLASNAQ